MLAIPSALLTGCEREATLCARDTANDSIAIELVSGDGHLADGVYDIAIEAAEQALDLGFAIDGEALDCTDEHCHASAFVDDERVDAAMTYDDSAAVIVLEGLGMASAVTSVIVAVERDDTTVGEGTLELDYRASPDRGECAATYYTAGAELEVD